MCKDILLWVIFDGIIISLGMPIIFVLHFATILTHTLKVIYYFNVKLLYNVKEMIKLGSVFNDMQIKI